MLECEGVRIGEQKDEVGSEESVMMVSAAQRGHSLSAASSRPPRGRPSPALAWARLATRLAMPGHLDHLMARGFLTTMSSEGENGAIGSSSTRTGHAKFKERYLAVFACQGDGSLVGAMEVLKPGSVSTRCRSKPWESAVSEFPTPVTFSP